MNISILLPTRKRLPLLKRSVDTLINNAKNPEKLQFLFGVDKDDLETYNYLSKSKYPNQVALQFNPLGYENLHKYNNTLAQYSFGKWIMFFNDDALMSTKNWDEKIMDFEDEFCLLRFKEQTNHPYSIFPCFPRDWFRCLDHISLHGQNDAWLSEIAYALDIMQDVDINVIHDRADITCLIQLSDLDEYEGGGTWFRRQKQLVKSPIGYATLHPGNITHKHGARATTKGTRYIVVSFMENRES